MDNTSKPSALTATARRVLRNLAAFGCIKGDGARIPLKFLDPALDQLRAAGYYTDGHLTREGFTAAMDAVRP